MPTNPMKTTVAVTQEIDTLLARYQPELQFLTPSERILLSAEAGQVSRLIGLALGRAQSRRIGNDSALPVDNGQP